MIRLLLVCTVFSASVCIVMSKLTSEEKNTMLNDHNNARKAVRPSAANMVKLKWDDSLATLAQNWADRCVYEHNPFPRPSKYSSIGENLYVSSGIGNPTRAISKWVGEKKYYKYSKNKSCNPPPWKSCGHYTQVVWATTSYVGCAAKTCASLDVGDGKTWSNALLVVCNYGNAGNFWGQKPYRRGKACSRCPSGTSCSDGLCV